MIFSRADGPTLTLHTIGTNLDGVTSQIENYFETQPDPILLLDDQSRVVLRNASARSLSPRQLEKIVAAQPGVAELTVDGITFEVQRSPTAIHCRNITATKDRVRSESARRLAYIKQLKTVYEHVDDELNLLQRVVSTSLNGYADWFALDLVTPASKIARSLAAPDNLIDARMFLEESGQVQHNATTLLLEKDAGALRSIALIPYFVGNKVRAVLIFGSAAPHCYKQQDLVFLEALSARAALAVENARHFAEERKAVQIRNDFLAIAAHELNTPLTTLSLQTQLLKRLATTNHLSSLPKDDLVSMLGQAETELARFSTLIENLLDVSRIVSGRIALNRTQVNLSALVAETVQRFHATIQKAGCDVTLSLDENALGCWDANRLAQIISNLLTNALKYGRGKPVQITVTVENEHAVLVVRDGGIGIAIEEQQKIFERFERSAAVEPIAGLGLGLYIGRELVEAHGGSISVTSTIDVGSTFTVRIPK